MYPALPLDLLVMAEDYSKITRTGRIARLKAQINDARKGIESRVPFGLRTILGLLLIVGGIFGFLPIVGFWMIPLGIAVIGIDVAVLWRAIARRK